MDLNLPVSQASRAYKMYARRLENLGILKLEDFLYHIPFRYDDYSLISDIEKLQEGEIVTIRGNVENIKNIYTHRHKLLQQATISDKTGTLNVLWFNQPFLTKVIKKGDIISLSGKININKGKPEMTSPDYEIIFNNQAIHTGRLVPVYPETKGISSKWLRRQIYKLLDLVNQINDVMPQEIIKENNLIPLANAIQTIHFPKSLEDANVAKKRLAFDELFYIQLLSFFRKDEWQKNVLKKPMKINKEKQNEFINSLPFILTASQQEAITQINKDLSMEKPMNRLLEGEVGSGKTVVACIAMYVSFLNGFQSAFMAPTEILAQQHYNVISKLLSPFGVKVSLITGSSKKTTKPSANSHKPLADITIGTHALIYNKVSFNKLGLIVIDEQQRFGVEQRAKIRSKGDNPHLLTMTATPIPRTVALTMYGDLDLSLLKDMPTGRKIVKTWLVSAEKRDNAYKWIEENIIKHKDQVFIVCPFIEESESMISVKAATKEFERLKTEVFPKLNLGLLHGKLKSLEKNEILNKFKNGDINILVSTPVVEVGIDIPAATIMLIEEAERFGLAQLHQLRGRVGRSDKQSYCLLFTQSKSDDTIKRLRSLETIYSGAELAELDLKLRGPGQIYGTIQHGVPNLKVANFSDFDLIEKTKSEAEKTFKNINNYPKLKAEINKLNNKQVSPD